MKRRTALGRLVSALFGIGLADRVSEVEALERTADLEMAAALAAGEDRTAVMGDLVVVDTDGEDVNVWRSLPGQFWTSESSTLHILPLQRRFGWDVDRACRASHIEYRVGHLPGIGPFCNRLKDSWGGSLALHPGDTFDLHLGADP